MTQAKVYSEITPNPNTLKFLLGKDYLERTYDFINREEAEKKSPLATKLFLIQDVDGVYLGKSFITVTKSSSKDWSAYEDKIIETIQEHLDEGESIIHEGAKKAAEEEEKKDLTETEQKIVDVINDEVRPAVAMDGGDIIYKGFEDGIVYLQLLGACAGCPSSTITLKMGIEMRLKEVVPEITQVVDVNAPAI